MRGGTSPRGPCLACRLSRFRSSDLLPLSHFSCADFRYHYLCREFFARTFPSFQQCSLHVSSSRDLRDFVQLSQPAMCSSELPHHSGGCGQNSQFSAIAADGHNRLRIAPCAGQPCCRTSRLPVPMSCYICPCISYAARCIGGVALRRADGVTTLERALWARRGCYSFSPRRPDGRN